VCLTTWIFLDNKHIESGPDWMLLFSSPPQKCAQAFLAQAFNAAVIEVGG
jgi:hypothetical protein